MQSSPQDQSVAAVIAALTPFTWRSLPPRLVARRVVAAADRHELVSLLGSVPGADVGAWEGPPRLADPEDRRVINLVEFLEAFTWTKLSLPLLCHHLVAVHYNAA